MKPVTLLLLLSSVALAEDGFRVGDKSQPKFTGTHPLVPYLNIIHSGPKGLALSGVTLLPGVVNQYTPGNFKEHLSEHVDLRMVVGGCQVHVKDGYIRLFETAKPKVYVEVPKESL